MEGQTIKEGEGYEVAVSEKLTDNSGMDYSWIYVNREAIILDRPEVESLVEYLKQQFNL